MKPTPKKPRIIIAQVEGSGTEAVTLLRSKLDQERHLYERGRHKKSQVNSVLSKCQGRGYSSLRHGRLGFRQQISRSDKPRRRHPNARSIEHRSRSPIVVPDKIAVWKKLHYRVVGSVAHAAHKNYCSYRAGLRCSSPVATLLCPTASTKGSVPIHLPSCTRLARQSITGNPPLSEAPMAIFGTVAGGEVQHVLKSAPALIWHLKIVDVQGVRDCSSTHQRR